MCVITFAPHLGHAHRDGGRTPFSERADDWADISHPFLIPELDDIVIGQH